MNIQTQKQIVLSLLAFIILISLTYFMGLAIKSRHDSHSLPVQVTYQQPIQTSTQSSKQSNEQPDTNPNEGQNQSQNQSQNQNAKPNPSSSGSIPINNNPPIEGDEQIVWDSFPHGEVGTPNGNKHIYLGCSTKGNKVVWKLAD